MKARFMAVVAMSLLGSSARAEIPDQEDAERFETTLNRMVATKIPKLSADQRGRFVANMRLHLTNHAQKFHSETIDRFLQEYSKSTAFVIVAANRPRTQEEYALELAVTKHKVDLFLEKSTLTDSDHRIIAEQIEWLAGRVEESLQKWFAGLDAPEFHALYADLKRSGLVAAANPIAELTALQKRNLIAASAACFHYAFRRPLKNEEIAWVIESWQRLVEQELPVHGFANQIAEFRGKLRDLMHSSDSAERAEEKQRMLADIRRMMAPAATGIAGFVKGVMKSPPTEEERAASAANRRRIAESQVREPRRPIARRVVELPRPHRISFYPIQNSRAANKPNPAKGLLMLEIGRPAAIGFDSARVDRVYARLTEWAHEDRITGAGIAIGRHGKMLEPRVFGRQRPDMGSPAMPDDAIFLIASPTKPITVTAVMMLVERGEIELDDFVVEFVPEFGSHGKDKIRIRHLMTHTSGLPDQLPENIKLRSEHAPLEAFVQGTCRVKPDFAPGTAVQYQSMGIAMLAEILRRVTGKPLRDFLRDELFQPLGLNDTALGAPDDWWLPAIDSSRPQLASGAVPQTRAQASGAGPRKADRFAHVRLDQQQVETDWNWNTRYWRSLGVPWGGLLTTPREFAVICQLFLDALKGEGPTQRFGKGDFGFGQQPRGTDRPAMRTAQPSTLLSPALARTMTLNQLQFMPDVPDADRRTRPWGLGWRLNWPSHSASFGDLLGPRTFGHWGATGTLVWMDPEADAYLVLFTTQPQEPEGRYLARISNMVCAAMV